MNFYKKHITCRVNLQQARQKVLENDIKKENLLGAICMKCIYSDQDLNHENFKFIIE